MEILIINREKFLKEATLLHIFDLAQGRHDRGLISKREGKQKLVQIMRSWSKHIKLTG